MRKMVSVWIVSAGCASAAFGAVSSTFSASAEGWSANNVVSLSANNLAPAMPFPTVTYSAAGGNPGGYVSVTDPGAGDMLLVAPSKFFGNQSDAYGTNLTYDLIYPTGTVDYQTTDVILSGSGSGSLLLYRPTTPFVPTTTWKTNTVPLSAVSGWHLDTTTGAQPTAAQFQNVLATLNGLYLRAEYSTGPETTGLDNVVLTPEPVGLVLAAVAAAGVLGRSRRR